MKRLMSVCGIAIVLASLATPASAGGFCSDGVYSDEATTTVVLKNICFSPTVARIEPGETVTFKNSDSVFHAVGGVAATFGDMHAELRPGKSVAFRFDDEGVFPYLCIYHPGMGGAVVVGDGVAAQGALPASQVDPGQGSGEAAAESSGDSDGVATSASQTSERGWIVGAGIALGLALLVVAALPRRRSPSQI